MRRRLTWAALCESLFLLLHAAPVAAIPVFARIYDKPCSACHTVFPQLNPYGEAFRAHGFHALPPAIKPLPVGSLLDVPGTLPLALYIIAGEDVTHVDAPAQSDSTDPLQPRLFQGAG